MNRAGHICALLLVLSPGLSGCGPPKAELTLTLPKTKWEVGEFLWYRLEVKNVGWRTIEFHDDFWFSRTAMRDNRDNRRGTFLLIHDANGLEARSDAFPFGFHGEQRLWDDDCGAGAPCPGRENRLIRLRPGQSWRTTASKEAPIRPLRTDSMFPLSDIRAGPSNSSPEELEAYKKLAESMFKYGDPRRQVGDGAVGVAPGFRILDTLTLPGPGRYMIKAVMDTRQSLPELSAEEEISRSERCAALPAESCAVMADLIRADWAKKTPNEVEKLRKSRTKVELENRRQFYIESKVIDFEVVPTASPGPALKPPRPLTAAEKVKERRMVELLEGKRR